MRALFSVIFTVAVAVVVGIGIGNQWPPSAVNPDPNHVHADFAVWIGPMKMNFDRPEWMSGLSTDASHDNEEGIRKFVHLHDHVGHVVHFHKPGLTIGDFFTSLKMTLTATCLRQDPDHADCDSGASRWRMFVNGAERPMDPAYTPQDGDKILLSYDIGAMAVNDQLAQMTSDACLYSKTCPWRGTPPTEGCIADPTVPCKE